MPDVQAPTEVTEPRVSELENVIGFDLETSGLDEQNDQILEVCARPGRIVNGKFETHPIGLWEGVSIVFPLMSNILEWHPAVVEMHTKNGLLAEAHAKNKALEKAYECSTTNDVGKYAQALAATIDDADDLLCKSFPKLEGKASWILLGNTVHFDLRFARRLFPKFAKRLSHRVIDVSSTRIFCEALGLAYTKDEPAHRAQADVEYSIKSFERYHEFATLARGIRASRPRADI